MGRMRQNVPKLRLHKPSGRAVVTLGGKDFYLGKHGTKEADANYKAKLAEFKNNHGVPAKTADVSIKEILAGYRGVVDGKYWKNGKRTSQHGIITQALRSFDKDHGELLANKLTPLILEDFRSELKQEGRKSKNGEVRLPADRRLARTTVNKKIRAILAAFRWAWKRELIDAATWYRLSTFGKDYKLAKNPMLFRDPPKVKPVAREHVDAIKDYVSKPVWALIEIQWQSSARAGEATIMRKGDIDKSRSLWVYTPSTHKTEHLDEDRVIYLIEQAQQVLAPFLKAKENDPDDTYLFSPRDVVATRNAEAARPRVKFISKKFKSHYSVTSYNRAIAKAIKQANDDRAAKGEPLIPHWHTHQLRHSAATWIAQKHGMEVARSMCGHSLIETTFGYVTHDRQFVENALAQTK